MLLTNTILIYWTFIMGWLLCLVLSKINIRNVSIKINVLSLKNIVTELVYNVKMVKEKKKRHIMLFQCGNIFNLYEGCIILIIITEAHF